MSAWAARSASTTSGVIRLASTTGNPSSSALALTGDGSSFLPRPRTASGRVTTSAISFPASTSEVSEGTAKSGVPIKTIRIKNVSPQPKPRRLQINCGKPSHQPIRNNNSTRTNIPKTKERAAIKAALSQQRLSAETPLPCPTAPGRKGARKRSPLPPQGLGYCSTRSSARAEEHLMCSSCEQDCLSMEQNLSPAAEGDGGTYSVSPGRAPRARASWYSLTALSLCIGFSRSNIVLPCR